MVFIYPIADERYFIDSIHLKEQTDLEVIESLEMHTRIYSICMILLQLYVCIKMHLSVCKGYYFCSLINKNKLV